MDLTEKVLAFQQGYWSWKNLWGSITAEINAYLTNKKLDHDEQAQFIQRFEYRAWSMANRFHYLGKTFRALLFTAVRFQLRNFYKYRNKQRQTERQIEGYAGHDQELNHPERNFGSSPRSLPGSFLMPNEKNNHVFCEPSKLTGQKRRILIVALKNCHALDDEAAVEIARKLNLSPEWLINSRDDLRLSSLYRQQHVKELRLRNSGERAWASYNVSDAETLKSLKRRFDRADNVIDKMNPYPHHAHIARLTGIPKGSIDSCLHYVRLGSGLGLANRRSGETPLS